MPAPTKEQLDRYMDLVVGGEEADDAIAVIWGEDPEPPKPTVMVTEFPDGVVIGWDHCAQASGGCGQSVRLCVCKDGPKELKVFEQWRSGAKSMPDYAAAGRAAKASGAPALEGTESQPTTGVVVATKTDQVACALGKHFVDIGEADRNDDGTWSCWACQEKGLQRGVQTDG